jgi:hypothetical protein
MTGEKRVLVLVGKPEAEFHLENQIVDGRMAVKMEIRDWLRGCGVDSPGSG